MQQVNSSYQIKIAANSSKNNKIKQTYLNNNVPNFKIWTVIDANIATECLSQINCPVSI